MKENDEAARKFLNLFKMIGVGLLALNVYWFCMEHNQEQDGINGVISKAWFGLLKGLDEGLYLLRSPYSTIIPAIIIFWGTSMGDKAVQNTEKKFFGRTFTPTHELGMKVSGLGLVIILVSPIALFIPFAIARTFFYVLLLLIGFLPFIYGLAIYTSTPKKNLSRDDPFNKKEQSAFPQNEKFKTDQYTINFPTKYYRLGKLHHGWINLEAPFRATIVLGTPGAGKSFTIINNYIRQALAKGFAMYLYDFKIPDLSELAFSNLMWNKDKWKEIYGGVEPKYGMVDFNEPRVSLRCNPLKAELLESQEDANQIAQVICYNLARTWADKQGDFFVESAINYLGACIWFLKLYEDGKYCTFPHVIDFISQPMDQVIPILASYSDLSITLAPFLNAWSAGATDQIQGQIASVQIPLGRLASIFLYWAMSGDDIDIDINNPLEPKLLCFGNDPQKTQVYGTALGVYTARMLKMANNKGKHKCAVVIDELPTMFVNGLDELIATARSNEVAVLLGFQDFTQLKAEYKEAGANKIIQTVGNIFVGQCFDDTAEKISKRIGKNKQQKESVSISESGTSISISDQMDYMVPPERFAQAGQGWFSGLVCDNNGTENPDRVFAADIDIDVQACIEEESHYLELPEFYDFDDEVVDENLRAYADEIGFAHSEYVTTKDLVNAMLRHWFDRNDIASKGFDHRKYKSISALIRKVMKPSKKMKSVFPQYRAKDDLLDKVIEIRDNRMREYLQNNRDSIKQEAENICTAELNRMKELAEQGVQPYQRLWTMRQNVLRNQGLLDENE
ncbi:MAG: type IV secretory system conjugative DNA transfer family protein [Paludibacteraceae bacterium]|nr:type IV secretory system conjugative DNA transfer family protein [Paludibacteraceae bacterium]